MQTLALQRKQDSKGVGHALDDRKKIQQNNVNHVGVPIFLQRSPAIHTESSLIQKQVESVDKIESIQSEGLSGEEAILQEKSATNLVQRQGESQEINEFKNEEEPEYQPKLTIGSPNDEYEKEADQVADKVMRQPNTSSVIEDEENQEKLLQTKPGYDKTIQRQSINDEHVSGNEQGVVQTKSDKSLHHLNKTVNSPGAGSSLPVSVRKKVEPVLGADLSDVKVHNDAAAHTTAKSINAKAFAHKKNIWLGPGQSPNDVQLMAHEATHIIQQGHSYQTLVQQAPSVKSSNNQVKKFTLKDADRQLKRMLNELLGINYKGKGVVNFNLDDIVITRGNYRTDWLQIWRKYWNRIPFSHSNKPACSLLAQAINKIYSKYDIYERDTLLLDKRSQQQKVIDDRHFSVWSKFDTNRIHEYTTLARILKKYGYKIIMGREYITYSTDEYADKTYKMPIYTTIVTPDDKKLVHISFDNIIPVMRMLVSAYGIKYLKGPKMYFINDLFGPEKSRLRASLDGNWISVLEKYAQGKFTDSKSLNYLDIENYLQQRNIDSDVAITLKVSNLEVTLQKILNSCLGKVYSLTEKSELSCIVQKLNIIKRVDIDKVYEIVEGDCKGGFNGKGSKAADSFIKLANTKGSFVNIMAGTFDKSKCRYW